MQRLSFPKQRSLQPTIIGLACVLALAVPATWQGWVAPFAGVAEVLVSPLAGPVSRLHRWLKPVPPPPGDSRLAALESDNQELRTKLLQQIDENQRLRTLLEQSRILPADAAGAMNQLAAKVTGVSADANSPALFVRAGSQQGIDVGNVATVQFAHLLGRVTGVRPRAATVLPITAPASGALDAVVLSKDVPGGLRTQLKPVGDGTLIGDVEDKIDPASQQPYQLAPGDEVRLADPSRWPMHAQMLMVGAVERVEPSPRQPLRKTVVVRPIVGDLLKVSEVVVQLPARTADAPGERSPR
jgi:hypothetical protein